MTVLLKRAFSVAVAAVLAAFVLNGCSVGSPPEEAVSPVVDEFYTAMQAGDLDKAVTYFSSKRLPEEWQMLLLHAHDKLGPVKRYKITNTEVNTNLRGRLYTYDVSVEYESGGAAEVVSIFNEVESDEIGIVSRAIYKDGYRAPGR